MILTTLTMDRAHDEAMGGNDPNLPEKPRRRTFTADYKLVILDEYDACAGDGDKGGCCAGRVSTRAISWSGGGLVMSAPWPGWPPRRDRASAHRGRGAGPCPSTGRARRADPGQGATRDCVRRRPRQQRRVPADR